VDQLLDRQTAEQYHLCLYVDGDDKWWVGSSKFRYPSTYFVEFQQWLKDSYGKSDYAKKLSGLDKKPPRGYYRGIPSALVAELALGADESSRLYPVEILSKMIPTISLASGDSLQRQDEIFRQVDEYIYWGSCYPLVKRPSEFLE
jgi:hypothetical protein